MLLGYVIVMSICFSRAPSEQSSFDYLICVIGQALQSPYGSAISGYFQLRKFLSFSRFSSKRFSYRSSFHIKPVKSYKFHLLFS